MSWLLSPLGPQLMTPRGTFRLALETPRSGGDYPERASHDEIETFLFVLEHAFEFATWSTLRPFLDLYAALGGERIWPSGAAPDPQLTQALWQRIKWAVTQGQLVFERVEVPIPRPRLEEVPEIPSERGVEEPTSEEHWLELELKDQDGNPVLGRHFRILQQGRVVREGRTDRLGFTRVERLGPGTAVIEFDDLEEVAWAYQPPLPGRSAPLASPEPVLVAPAMRAESAPAPAEEACAEQEAPTAEEGPAIVPSCPEAEEPTTTWFEVTVLDDLGEPLPDVPLVFSLADGDVERSTDGAGTARVENVARSACSVRFSDCDTVRSVLFERWESPREGERPEDDDLLVLPAKRSIDPVELAGETPRRLSLVPNVIRVRLVGFHFDTCKCFLRPEAMDGIQKVARVYQQHPGASLLVVGHTDDADKHGPEYNDQLSLERARAVEAYLSDDVAGWQEWYGSDQPWEKRWGNTEDQYMIRALIDRGHPYSKTSTWQALYDFQTEQGLTQDGSAGPETREALIREYMALDGTTLPEGFSVRSHGCGQHKPVVTADEEPNLDRRRAANRRVEIFVFDGPVVPPPPGDNSGPSDPQYEAWVAMVVQDIDVSNDAADSEPILIRLRDEDGEPMTSAPYRVTFGEPGTGEVVENVSNDGWVAIQQPPGASYQTCLVEWGTDPSGFFAHRLEVSLTSEMGDLPPAEEARHKLNNLGYTKEFAYEDVIYCFQWNEGLPAGLEADGSPPPETMTRIRERYDQAIAGQPA